MPSKDEVLLIIGVFESTGLNKRTLLAIVAELD